MPSELNGNLFGRNILNRDTRVSSITAGLHHFGAINSKCIGLMMTTMINVSYLTKDKGELFMWGKNNRANLGIGSKHDMMFPYRVGIRVNLW